MDSVYLECALWWTPDATWPRRRATLTAIGGVATCLALGGPALAQNCQPVSQRTGELGCWIMATTVLGQLPEQPLFWHLDTFPARAAAEAAQGPRGTVVEALGQVWLLTIEVAGWRPSGGERVVDIGPLPVSAGVSYVSEYMEAVFTPGMTAPVHRHAGPEAWYTVSGETCLETPDGKMLGRAGGGPGHRAGRPADASHGHGHGDTPRTRAHPARRVAAGDDAGERLDAEGAVPITLGAASWRNEGDPLVLVNREKVCSSYFVGSHGHDDPAFRPSWTGKQAK